MGWGGGSEGGNGVMGGGSRVRDLRIVTGCGGGGRRGGLQYLDGYGCSLRHNCKRSQWRRRSRGVAVAAGRRVRPDIN